MSTPDTSTCVFAGCMNIPANGLFTCYQHTQHLSTPDTFRDALALSAFTALLDADQRRIGLGKASDLAADAVLASDEMRATRPVLRWVGEYALRFDWHMPEHVIRWVLDDPSPDSPADKPCETCHGSGRTISISPDAFWVPCPSCRGGEPT